MPASYAYLGPEGTFTEVALRTLPETATRELVPYVSVQSALDAVRAGEAEAAFVPIENSVEGGITTTLDELVAGSPRMIYREVLLSITFALLVRPGTNTSDIKTVTAQPAAQPPARTGVQAPPPDAHWESAASNAARARPRPAGRAGRGGSRRAGTTPASPGSSRRPGTGSSRWRPGSTTRRTPRPGSCWWAAPHGPRPPRVPTRPPWCCGSGTTIPADCAICWASSP